MSVRFHVLVIRLLMAIHKFQLMTLGQISQYNDKKQILVDAEEFIHDYIQKEKEPHGEI